MTNHTDSRTPSAHRALRAAAAVVATGSLLLIASSPVSSAAPLPEPAGTQAKLRHILKSHHADRDFVGARISLRDSNGKITEATAGTTATDRASGPVDLDTEWNIGSATKTFVAVVVLQLADEGLLDLDAGIQGFMPNLPDAGRITPRQLLQHTTGLHEYINEPAVVDNALHEWTVAELLEVAEKAGRVGEPGGAYHYSNTNFIILGEIIRQVTGNSWGDEVRSRIAEPLGMSHTRAMTDERPVGYQKIDGAFVDWTFRSHPSMGGAAGALLSTTGDLLVFAQALAEGTLLSPDSHAAMQTFVPGEDYSPYGIVHSYGLGLEQYVNDAVTVRGHMGTGQAQSAFIGYDLEHGTAVAVATNTATTGPQAIMAIEALTAVGAAG